MAKDRKRKLKKDQREFRRLQKAIAALPKPSFNNHEKVQPAEAVKVPKPIASTLIAKPSFISPDERVQKPTDTTVILDTTNTRVEKVAGIKKPKKRWTIGRVFAYSKKHWHLLAMSIVFALANSVFEIFIPLLIGNGIDFLAGPGEVDFDGVLKFIIAISVCIVCFAVFKWLTTKTANDLAYRIEQEMHNDLFKKFNKVPLKIIDNSSHGDLQSRMINDVDMITDGFVLGLTTFFDCLASISLTLVFMFKINVPIAITIVCITPLSIIVASIIAKLSHKLFKRQAKHLGDLSGVLVEMIGNQKVVAAFGFEDRSIAKFDEINSKLRTASVKANFYSSLSGPVSRFINGILYAIVAIMGGLYALKGVMTIGNISTLLAYANKYTKPFNEITEVFTDLQAAFASAVRVFNVLDLQNEPSDENLPQIKRCTGEVDFNHVDFSYTPEKKLIQNLNLHVSKAQRVAIVGPTGCGKSTLINLLMRFYDTDKGEILVSRKNIKNVTRSSLRKNFGMVLQETWLFSASIKENIAYGNQHATDQEIRKAARLAGADFFIQTLPNGYDTIINENGDNLSQGQKQLLCIARLLLTKPPMLILDEATSNIDTRTELAIQAAFNHMMQGKTSFVVAHRLSTITSSDIILVMNKGSIIEQGSHKQLLAKKGFYYNLYNSQFSKY